MQSPTQANSGPNPVTTTTTEKQLDTKPGAQPVPTDRDAQEEENKSAIIAETETPITQQENGEQAETPASMAVTQAVENEPAVQPLTQPSDNTGGMELGSASTSSVPINPVSDINTNSGCDRKMAKNQDKGVRDGRKYVPSKKAMVDPLKMDMSKPLVIPLTCEYFTLYMCLPGLRDLFGV